MWGRSSSSGPEPTALPLGPWEGLGPWECLAKTDQARDQHLAGIGTPDSSYSTTLPHSWHHATGSWQSWSMDLSLYPHEHSQLWLMSLWEHSHRRIATWSSFLGWSYAGITPVPILPRVEWGSLLWSGYSGFPHSTNLWCYTYSVVLMWHGPQTK